MAYKTFPLFKTRINCLETLEQFSTSRDKNQLLHQKYFGFSWERKPFSTVKHIETSKDNEWDDRARLLQQEIIYQTGLKDFKINNFAIDDTDKEDTESQNKSSSLKYDVSAVCGTIPFLVKFRANTKKLQDNPLDFDELELFLEEEIMNCGKDLFKRIEETNDMVMLVQILSSVSKLLTSRDNTMEATLQRHPNRVTMETENSLIIHRNLSQSPGLRLVFELVLNARDDFEIKMKIVAPNATKGNKNNMDQAVVTFNRKLETLMETLGTDKAIDAVVAMW